MAFWTELADRVEAMRIDVTTDLAAEPYAIPASDYISPETHQRELDVLFHGGPVLAGLSGAADGHGGWFTVDVAGRSVLVVRGEDGELRAFRNACPHRGMRLQEGSGTGLRRITCPFHAWSFDQMGTNRGIPMREAFEQYDAEDLDLEPMQVAESHGVIWVSFGAAPIDTDWLLGGVHRELDQLGMADQVLIGRVERHFDMNWKLGVDSYMEAYHLHYLHKETLRNYFLNHASPFDSFGPNGRIGGVRRSIEGAESPDQLLDHLTLEYQMFPNAVIIYQQDHFELSQVFPHPESPHRATVVQSVYAPREGLTDERRARFLKSFELLLGVTVAEDFSACEAIQRNLRSGSPSHLRLGRNEPGVIHFHRALLSRLDGARD